MRKPRLLRPQLVCRLSGGFSQRQIIPQAAWSFGQPRPISRSVRAGRPHRPSFPQPRAGCAGLLARRRPAARYARRRPRRSPHRTRCSRPRCSTRP
eukprot:scaffold36530_cov35-Phaeocystis_antarctica.AAC.2